MLPFGNRFRHTVSFQDAAEQDFTRGLDAGFTALSEWTWNLNPEEPAPPRMGRRRP